MSTESTIAHHLGAFGEGIESIMSDYTADSVVFTPDGPLQGLEKIRPFFDGFLQSPDLLNALTVTRQDIVGDVVYLLWKAEPLIPFAGDTFLIRDDKIVMQSVAIAPVAAAVTAESSTVAVDAVS